MYVHSGRQVGFVGMYRQFHLRTSCFEVVSSTEYSLELFILRFGFLATPVGVRWTPVSEMLDVHTSPSHFVLTIVWAEASDVQH